MTRSRSAAPGKVIISHVIVTGRQEQMRCVPFWLLVCCSSCARPRAPHRCVTPAPASLCLRIRPRPQPRRRASRCLAGATRRRANGLTGLRPWLGEEDSQSPRARRAETLFPFFLTSPRSSAASDAPGPRVFPRMLVNDRLAMKTAVQLSADAEADFEDEPRHASERKHRQPSRVLSDVSNMCRQTFDHSSDFRNHCDPWPLCTRAGAAP